MNDEYADWVVKAAMQIARDEGTASNPIRWQDVAETIDREWERFTAGTSDTPPVVPPNPLEERIAALELQMDMLMQSRKAQPKSAGFHAENCQERACTYYNHYLENYQPTRCGEKLDHAQFHAVEGCCESVQRRITNWSESHPNQPIPEHLMKQANYWESRCAF